MKDAIEAGEVDAKDIESIKKVRAAVPTVLLPETLAAGSDDEEEERTVYQKKRLLSLEVARASRVRGVGAGTSHSHEHDCSQARTHFSRRCYFKQLRHRLIFFSLYLYSV